MLQYSVTLNRCLEAGVDFIGDFVIRMREMRMLPLYQTRVYTVQTYGTGHIVCITFDKKNEESKRRAHWLIDMLIKDCAEHGRGEYRTHLAVMDQVALTYDFNDNAQMKINEQIKDALDPKGILAPGKNGVWPKNYNKEEWRIPKSVTLDKLQQTLSRKSSGWRTPGKL